MERTLIALNVPNMITIVLMATLGYLIFGVASQMVLGQFRGAVVGSD